MTNYNSPFYYYDINRQRQLKKSNIRKTLSGLGFLVFSSELVFQLLFLLFSIFLGISGISSNSFFYKNYEAITESFHGVALFVGLFFVSLMYCCLSNTKLSSVIQFEKVKANKLIAYVFLGLSITYMGNILSGIFLEFLSSIGISDTTDISMEQSNNLGTIIATFITAVTPAFAEEFMFRGVILGKMRKYGDSFAIIASSLLFAMMHGNLQQISFAFIGGMFFAFVTVKTNSLLPAMIIHFANNLLSCILQVISACGNTYIGNFVPIVIFTAVLGLGILSFAYLAKRDKDAFKIEKAPVGAMAFSLKENMQLFFSNIGTIFALIILLLETMSNISLWA